MMRWLQLLYFLIRCSHVEYSVEMIKKDKSLIFFVLPRVKKITFDKKFGTKSGKIPGLNVEVYDSQRKGETKVNLD